MICKSCGKTMDLWNWIRFSGIGVWKDKNKYHGCPNCHKRVDGSAIPKVVVDTSVGFISVDRRMKAHESDIHTRVIGDDGVTVLKGNDGLKYMKSKADKVPGYANRLRDYYKL